MILQSSKIRYYMICGFTDMRKSFDSLAGIVHSLGHAVSTGDVFVFCNKRRNRIKLLYYDGTGLWVCAKRLDRQCFEWHFSKDRGVVVCPNADFLRLTEGKDKKYNKL